MSFQTPQLDLAILLRDMREGKIQLPDFQRSYKWDDERIRQLLVTVLRGHPMGVVLLLQSGGDQVRFKPKPLEGCLASNNSPDFLLLDGQQRLTSLLQSLSGTGVVSTEDERGKRLTRRYFLDVERATGGPSDQDDAIISLPEDGILRTNFGRDVVMDASTRENELREGLMPVPSLFSGDYTNWMLDYLTADAADSERRMQVFRRLNEYITTVVLKYQVPAILLDKATTKDAVATVFEKVNTGGLPLNTFELLTATFAGDGDYFRRTGSDFRLGEHWDSVRERFAGAPVLSKIDSVAFLQGVTLLATRERRLDEARRGLPRPSATSARKSDILRLGLDDYLQFAEPLASAFLWAATFVDKRGIHAPEELPYPAQLTTLAVLRVILGEAASLQGNRDRLMRWFWSGALGELYGRTTETRLSIDVDELPDWILGLNDDEPRTVATATFQEQRLYSLKTRASAAYLALYAMLMAKHPSDWVHDEAIDLAHRHHLDVDIHHIFPKDWCAKQGIDSTRMDCIVNKTGLSAKTNRHIVRGSAPSRYLARTTKAAKVSADEMDELLRQHYVDPAALRADDFDAFFDARKEAIIALVERAMGKPVVRASDIPEGAGDFADRPGDFSEEPASMA